jgi:hypothetical protein
VKAISPDRVLVMKKSRSVILEWRGKLMEPARWIFVGANAWMNTPPPEMRRVEMKWSQENAFVWTIYYFG